MIDTLKRILLIIGFYKQHDVEQISFDIFRCKQCGKYFEMNYTFRQEIEEKEAIELLNGFNKQIETMYQNNEHPIFVKPLIKMGKEINFYKTIGYKENLTIDQEICRG